MKNYGFLPFGMQLTVKCRLDHGKYPIGQKVSKKVTASKKTEEAELLGSCVAKRQDE